MLTCNEFNTAIFSGLNILNGFQFNSQYDKYQQIQAIYKQRFFEGLSNFEERKGTPRAQSLRTTDII